jgi:hypothetical protein
MEDRSMTGFWRTWMTAWCWAVMGLGVMLTGAAFEATSGPTRLLFAVLNGPEPLELSAQMRFSEAVLGAVTLGWGLTLMAAIGAANLLGDAGRPVWRMIVASVLVWWCVDSALSMATGYGLNVVTNTLFVAAFLLPILRTGVLGARTVGDPRALGLS